jgi:succinate dehydrogenase / fumarate reductase cytochrome b subunit
MKWLSAFARSSIGAKIIMAVTGLLLFGFVIGHMLGNLQMFLGQDAVNKYAASLKDLGALLWVVRIGLLLIAVVHVISGIRLARLNRSARPVPYQKNAKVQASLGSVTMVQTGVLVLAFVVYHLLHFTFGVVQHDSYAGSLPLDQGRHDVFSMTVIGFQSWLVSGSYIVAMLLLGLHLSHGVTSLFQSIGLDHPRIAPLAARLGPISALIIVVGNCSMPIACLLGLVQPGAGVS